MPAQAKADDVDDERVGMIQKMLVKLAPVIGLNKAEAEWFWGKVADKLHDVDVLVYGGQLRGGAEFPGLAVMAKQLADVQADVQAMRDVVDVDPVRINGKSVTGHHDTAQQGKPRVMKAAKKGSR